MPKLKTRKAAAKRFRVTKKGKVLYKKAFKGHLLAKKKRSRKVALRRKGQLALKSESRTIRMLLPYS